MAAAVLETPVTGERGAYGPSRVDTVERPSVAPQTSAAWECPEEVVLLQQIAAVLQQLCDDNSDLRAVSPTIFDSVARPAMSIHCYLVRIRRYTKFDSICFLAALAYLRRLCDGHGAPFCPTHHNIHRLFISAVLIASKANDDVFHANVFMAQCGGITNLELNKLELELCERLRWSLVLEADELAALTDHLLEPRSVFWKQWSTEWCQQRWRACVMETPEARVQPCDAADRLTTPSPSKHQRSLSLGKMRGKPSAMPDVSPVQSKECSPDPSNNASPRSVLSRTMSFGGFLGSFSALVSLGS